MEKFQGKDDILNSIKPIIDDLKFIQIDTDTIEDFCSKVEPCHIPTPDWDFPAIYPNLDEIGIDYFMILNCLNFCYWGSPKWTVEFKDKYYDGAFGMFAALYRALEDGIPIYQGEFLAGLTQTQLSSILRGNVEIPLFEPRLNILREVGRTLLDEFDGRFFHVVEEADKSAVKLVEILTNRFPSFNDSVVWEDNRVIFHKRAQLAPAMIFEHWKGDGTGAFSDIDQLTVSADYKLPQVLRRLNILRYQPSLEQLIDENRRIPANSREELEIRAATILAGELMRDKISQHIPDITSQGVDRFIWLIGQTKVANEKPYHKTLTTMY